MLPANMSQPILVVRHGMAIGSVIGLSMAEAVGVVTLISSSAMAVIGHR